VFLPGEGEIRRVAAQLAGRVPGDVTVHPLYGALPFAAQRAAIAPVIRGRKVVLATSIAETALTIQDVRVVVDAGLARRSRFDAGRGMSQLVTERVTKAEATQRRGRAGRVAPGVCYRMWTKGEEGGLAAFPPPEIAAADLTGLALDLAMWGARDATGLAFLTPPPDGPLAEARRLLCDLGALGADGTITDHGRRVAAMPLHPRLAHMLAVAGPDAAGMAALLSGRDPLRGRGVDLALRHAALRDPARFGPERPALERIATEARRLRKIVSGHKGRDFAHAEQAALAYPDRIGQRRAGDAPRWVLSGGTGAMMDAGEPLAGARLIVATDLDGGGREARIRQAIEMSEAELRGLYADRIAWHDVCLWSKRDRAVQARRQERFGAVVLADQHWADAPAGAMARAMLDGVRQLGLPWTNAARRFRSRVELLRGQGSALPDCSDEGLLATVEDWLLPHLAGVRTAEALAGFDILPALRDRLDWAQTQDLDRLAPSHFTTPLDRRVPIDYGGGAPEITVRLQEMFGVTVHPTIGPARLPLKVTLLSPGQRPVQTTTDLPGFWATSYADVRKDMRGRYPKHPWPEDPTVAEPTLRAKPRK
jgi:ATP-dependent helicase HrpB